MKVTVTRENLIDLLSTTVPATPTRTTLPVLSNVLIEAQDGRITMTANDLDKSIIDSRPAEVHTAGTITVPAKKLQALVRELPAGAITLQTKGSKLRLRAKEADFGLVSLPAEEYPALPSLDFTGGFSVSASVLRELIGRSSYAVSTEETRPILNGVLWEIRDNEMRMVATNGHRLAKNVYYSNGSTPSRKGQMIVRPDVLNLLDRMLGDTDSKEVTVTQNNNFIGFRVGEHACVYGRLIDGPYPNYEQVIPKDNDRLLVVDRQEMEQVVRRVAVVASDQTHRIVLTLEPTEVRVSVETADLGDGGDRIPAEFTGEPMRIAFNANYLLEALRKVPAERVSMSFKHPDRAVMIEPTTIPEGAPEFSTLIMPLRIEA